MDQLKAILENLLTRRKPFDFQKEFCGCFQRLRTIDKKNQHILKQIGARLDALEQCRQALRAGDGDVIQTVMSDYRAQCERLRNENDIPDRNATEVYQALQNLADCFNRSDFINPIKTAVVHYLEDLEQKTQKRTNQVNKQLLQACEKICEVTHCDPKQLTVWQATAVAAQEIITAIEEHKSRCHANTMPEDILAPLSRGPSLEGWVTSRLAPINNQCIIYLGVKQLLDNPDNALSIVHDAFKNGTLSHEHITEIAHRTFHFLIDSHCTDELLNTLLSCLAGRQDAAGISLFREQFIGLIADTPEKVCKYLNYGLVSKEKSGQPRLAYFSQLSEYLYRITPGQLQPLQNNRDLCLTAQQMEQTGKLWRLLQRYYGEPADETLAQEMDQLCRGFLKNEVQPVFCDDESARYFLKLCLQPTLLDKYLCVPDAKLPSYSGSVFFRNGAGKQKALKALQQLLVASLFLPTSEREHLLKQWESRFGAEIDQPRYRYLVGLIVGQCIRIYATLRKSLGMVGAHSDTKSRILANRLQALCRANTPEALKSELEDCEKGVPSIVLGRP